MTSFLPKGRRENAAQVDENAANFAEYFRMYGEPTVESEPCVPLLTYDGARSEIKSRLRSALPLV